MERNRPYTLLLATLLLGACLIVFQPAAIAQKRILHAAKQSSKDSTLLKETFNEEDVPANEYLTEQLAPIRANFKRINSTTRWTSKKEANIETGEGGSITYYYLKGKLEKIVFRQYGEMFQQLNEYYLLNGRLSFVFERSYRYNRPIYYDTATMKANNDTEAFDLEKAEVEENRNYFEKGQLIHQLNNQDCGAPFAADYLKEEQERIKAEFRQALKRQKK